MRWLFTAARRLRELGILGMNRRNAACILDHNPRAKYPIVDDKLRMHRLCRSIRVPTPDIYAEVSSYSMLRRLPQVVPDRWAQSVRLCGTPIHLDSVLLRRSLLEMASLLWNSSS